MRGCRPPAADCLCASAQRTLEAQNMGVDFTRPAVKQVYEVITPVSANKITVLWDCPDACIRAFYWIKKKPSEEGCLKNQP